MKIGNKIIRTNFLINKKYQLSHIAYTALIIFLVVSIVGYIVFITSWSYAVNKTLQSLTSFPNERLITISKGLLLNAFFGILAISIIFTALWALFFSHRLAGPAWKFKNILGKIESGDYTTKVTLRDNDYLKDLALSFNTTLKALEDKNTKQLSIIKEMQTQTELLSTIDPKISEDKLRDLAHKLALNLSNLQKTATSDNS